MENIQSELKKYENDIFEKENKDVIDSAYQKWLDARNEMLIGMTDKERELIENKIKLKILKMFKKRKGDYFHYSDFVFDSLISQHFNFIVTSGDRNIGKTTSAKSLARDIVNKGYRFEWMRNIQDEIKMLVKSDNDNWFSKMGWTYDNLSAPNIYDMNDKLVGYYRDVNTVGKFKSIEFDNVALTIWDEFNSRVNVGEKFAKFAEHIVTVQRHREKYMCILQANFVSQHDEMLEKLGVGGEKLDNKNFVKFNWITGALMIFIPSGIYKSVSNDIKKKKKNIGYRTSLNDQHVFQSQYGGGFQDAINTNIINQENISAFEALFNIYHSVTISSLRSQRLTMYKAYDKDGKPFNFLTNTKENNNKPIFVFDHINKIRYINSIILESTVLENLILAWRNNQIKTDSQTTYESIIKIFAAADKIIDKQKFVINDVENLVK